MCDLLWSDPDGMYFACAQIEKEIFNARKLYLPYIHAHTYLFVI